MTRERLDLVCAARSIPLIALLLLTSCATPCNNFGLLLLYPLAAFDPHTYRGKDGSGLANAVILNGPKGDRETAEAESAFIYKKFNIDSQQANRRTLRVGDVYYHIVTVKTNGGQTREVWFDITTTIQ